MERPLVLTAGTFDTPHLGHAIFLQNAAKLGRLVVALGTDDYVLRYKGKKPVFDFSERSNLVKMLDFVSEVVPNDQDSLLPQVQRFKPDFIVIGSDWGDRYFEQIKLDRVQLHELGVTMVYLPYTTEISSTMIKERCK